jgi:hypothetical protein
MNEAGGAVPQDLTNIAVQVIVGGKSAHITYRGRSSCCAGLDQIVFDVPQNVQGCNVSVMVQINDAVSNVTTMAVANNGKCSDPNSLSSADLSKLLNNRKIGFVLLDRVSIQTTFPFFGTSTTTVDIGSASFFSIEAQKLISSPLPIKTASFGSCTVTTFSGNQAGTAIPSFSRPGRRRRGFSDGVRGHEADNGIADQRLLRCATGRRYWTQCTVVVSERWRLHHRERSGWR